MVAAPRRDSHSRATDLSTSGKESANAMRFFEVNPYASAEDTLTEIQWSAERSNAKYYGERGRCAEGHDAGTAPSARTGNTNGRNRSAARKYDSAEKRPRANTHAEREKPGKKRTRAISR